MPQQLENPDLTAAAAQPSEATHSKPDPVPQPGGKSVTISVVSHGQDLWVKELLAQIDAWCSAHVKQVIVTQNLPNSDATVFATYRFPVLVRQNATPAGFGANHNAAFRQCDTEWFLVINPDLVIDTNVIGELIQFPDPNVGLIAPAVWEPGASQATPERGVITPWEVFGGRLFGRRPQKRALWFPGMFMLFRTTAYASVRGFDERYHMYCEDYEICSRLRRSNWELRRVHHARVMHLAQRDSHIHAQYLAWHLRSLARLWGSLDFWRDWRNLRLQR